MQSILDIQNVTKVYKTKSGTTSALNGVTLSINAGEIFGLLGVNGAGKTTLSSIIATLHPATSGKILFNGQNIYDHIIAYRRQLGYCPQQQNLDEYLNVYQNLQFAGRYQLLPEPVIKQRIDLLLAQFNLTRYAYSQVHELSGGTKQRLLIARALIHEPKIVILDEPTVGLDPDIRRILWDHILQLKQQGITVILTTHYLDEAEVLSDRVCILNKGTVLTIQSVKELKESHDRASLEDIFLQILAQHARE